MLCFGFRKTGMHVLSCPRCTINTERILQGENSGMHGSA